MVQVRAQMLKITSETPKTFFSATNNRFNSVSLQVLQHIMKRLRHMWNRVFKTDEAATSRQRRKFVTPVLTCACFVIATVLFALQTSQTVSRYMRHDIQQASITVQNRSLLMPTVLLKLESLRNDPKRDRTLAVEMTFDVSFDNAKVPDWAFVETHKSYEHSVRANVINYDLSRNNLSFGADMENTVFVAIFVRVALPSNEWLSTSCTLKISSFAGEQT